MLSAAGFAAPAPQRRPRRINVADFPIVSG